MNAVERALRGRAVSRLLARCGIDPKRYWLLVDLFHQISERGEMLDQLGRNGVALGTASILYAVMSALVAAVSIIAGASPSVYLATFLFFTAFLFGSILLSEAGNSLVNPVEGMVLAHQPITGSTYTAAKLSHLVRIVLWLTPALDGIPAVAGLALRGAPWYYPVEHLAAAFTVAFVCAMIVCAAFGWLLRFVPSKRLKAAGQFAGAVPFVGMMWMGQLQRLVGRVRLQRFIPADPAMRRVVIASAVLAALAAVFFGLRSLSADYLIRVSAMMRGGAHGGARSRPSLAAAFVARFCGGQPARAGFVYTGRLMRRDWQFRRQFLATAAMLLIGGVSFIVKGWRDDPFAEQFSTVHLLPHTIGLLVIVTASLFPQGSDYKAAWIFHLAPPSAIERFAAGPCAVLAYAVLWLHVVVAPFVLWSWSALHAALFLVYSLAVCAVYLGVALRLPDAIPFTRQPDPKRAVITMPMVLLAFLVIGIAIGIQHFLLFRSTAAVLAVATILGVGGTLGTRSGVAAFGAGMRNQLSETSGAPGPLYLEVEV